MPGKSTKNKDIDELVRDYKLCDDEKKRQVLHIQIIEKGLALVKRFVNPILKQTNVSYEDLVQVGALGLIKAIDCFSPDKNTRFTTYATYYIRGELKHYLRDKASFIKTPRKVHELIVKVFNTVKELSIRGNPDPTVEDIAASIKLPPEKIEEIMKFDSYKSMVSLDQTISVGEDGLTLLEHIPADDYQDTQNFQETKLLIEKALEELNPELKQIIELNFFEELNQREISEKLGISQMQVSRSLKKALNEMYKIINRKDII